MACMAAQAGHPLVTDDTGTQGVGHSQIELNTDWTGGNGYDGQVADFTYTHGLTDRIDVALDVPSMLSSPAGFNDVEIGFKWRIAEKGGASLAITPTLSLPTANQQRGLGDGKINPGITLIGSYVDGPWTWLTNVGLVSNYYRLQAFRTANREIVRRASTAVLYALNSRWSLATDLGISQNTSRFDKGNPAFILVGAIYSPNQTIDLDAGLKFGLNDAGPSHQAGVGLTVHY